MKSGQGLWSKFWALSCLERWFFIEAVLLHLWIGLLLKVLPFRYIPRFFASPKSKVQSPKSEDIDFIRRAIQRAGKVSPWKNRCLVSSLAGRSMLSRRKIHSQLSLGVTKVASGKVIAHAWLRAGDVEIVTAGGSFQELYHF